MANQARNDVQLKAIFLPKIKEVVEYVVQKILEENEDVIQYVVYDAYDTSVYNRTGEFKEAWSTNTESNMLTSHVTGEFFYDPSKLTPGDNSPESPRYGQHVSAIDRMLMTTYLAEVIYEGLAGPAFGHGVQTGAWAQKRDAWKELTNRIGKRKMDTWFKEGFAKVGIPIHSHGSVIGVFLI